MPVPLRPLAAARRLWRVLRAAPHRLFLLAGAMQLVLTVALWGGELTARLGAGGLPLAVPALWAHGLLMVYGVFPFYIFGFLFTVYPRWLRVPPLAPHHYLRVFWLLAPGWGLVYAGLWGARAWLAAGLALVLAGHLGALATLLASYRAAGQPDAHVRLINLALALGSVGLGAFLIALLAGHALAAAVAREAGLWGFLVPIVFSVSHRMIPFFSSSVLMNYVMVRPAWGPPLMLVCATGHAACELAGVPAWRFLFDAPLAATALHHSYVWQFRRSFHSRLLAMTHVAFLWLGVAMTLYAAQSLVWLIAGSDGFGRAPLHALGIGFLAGMVVAMGSRVTLGHSGRALAADTRTWVALLGLSATALIRMAAEFVPARAGWLNLAAALAWLLCVIPWVLQYAPLYWRARADGQPG